MFTENEKNAMFDVFDTCVRYTNRTITLDLMQKTRRDPNWFLHLGAKHKVSMELTIAKIVSSEQLLDLFREYWANRLQSKS